HRVLTDLILDGNNKILNSINDKKDKKQASKVNGSMNLDFSKFLLNYTQRFYVKQFDMVTLLVSLSALFVVMVSVVVSISSGINDKIISNIIALVILGLLLVTLNLL